MSRLGLANPHRGSRPAARVGTEAGPRPPAPEGQLDELLERWAAGGLITREQAAAVLAAERERAAPVVRARGVPIVAELLGYLGATLALAGAAALAISFWTDLAPWGRLTILGLASMVFAAAGVLVREHADPTRRRLRGFLWLLSSVAAGFFAGVLADDVLDAAGEAVTLLTGLVVTAHAGALWRLRPRPLQHLACLAGLAMAVAGAADLVAGRAAPGLGVWAVGAAWIVLGWRALLPPPTVALAAGAVTTLVGASMVIGGWDEAGLVLGLATALALLTAGTIRRRFVLAAIGTAGVMVYLPPTIDQFFAGTVGVPIGILLSGLILLGVTLLLLRRSPPPAAR